jgi:hypothetical protein
MSDQPLDFRVERSVLLVRCVAPAGKGRPIRSAAHFLGAVVMQGSEERPLPSLRNRASRFGPPDGHVQR